MSKKSVGIDVDGVLANIHSPALDIFAKRYGFLTKYNDISNWNYLQERYKISRSQFLAVLDEAWVQWIDVPFVETTIVQDLGLLHHDFNVVLITKRTRGSLQNVLRWLQFHHFQFNELIFLMSGRKN